MFCRKSLAVLLLGGVLGFAFSSTHGGWGGSTTYPAWGGGGTGSDTECSFDGAPIVLDAFDNNGAGPAVTPGRPGVHAEAVDVQFNDNGALPDTITRAGGSGSWVDEGFREGMKIAVKGTSLNDSVKSGTEANEFYTIAQVTATVLTLVAEDQLANEGTLPDNPVPATIYSLVQFTLTGAAPCRQVNDDSSVSEEVQVNFDITYTGINRDCFGTVSLGHAVNPGCLSSAFVTDNPPHTIQGKLVLPATSASAPFTGCVVGQTCTLCVANPPVDTLTPQVLADFYGPTETLPQDGSFRFTEFLLPDGTVDPDRLKFDSRYAHGVWVAGDNVSCPSELLLKTKGTPRPTVEDWSGLLLLTGDLEATSLNVASTTGQVKFTVDPQSQNKTCADINPSTVKLEGVAALLGSENEKLGNGTCRSQFDWGLVQAAMGAKAPFIEGEFRTLVWTAELLDDAKVQSSDSAKIVFNFNETVQFTAAGSCVNEPAEGTGAIPHLVQVQLIGTPISVVNVDAVDTRTGSASKQDYSFSRQALTFDAGNLSRTVSVTIKDNNPNNENDETVILELVNLAGPAELGANFRHIVTIKDKNLCGP